MRILNLISLIRNRPLFVFSYARTYFLFTRTRILRFLFSGQSIRFGKNLRLQRLSCVFAERPSANIDLGDHTVIYENARIAAFGQGRIQIGECSIIGDVRISSRHQISIGKRFLTSWNVLIQDFDPHPIDPIERGRQVEYMCANLRPGSSFPHTETSWSFPGTPILIGDDVWVGANATILKGARIGAGSIVATGAVVLEGEYPPKSLIAGNPARIVSHR